MSHLLHLGNQGFNAGGLHVIKDLQVGDTVLPMNTKDGVEGLHVKFL